MADRGDPSAVAEQIRILQEQFQVTELVSAGDRGMVKSKIQQALQQEHPHYITALTDPQIRLLLGKGVLQIPLFSEAVCEVEHDKRRYVLRKNEAETVRIERRLDDKFNKLEDKIKTRN